MPFKEHSWVFPKDSLLGETLFLCTRPTGLLKRRRVFGARLECKELMLPDINFGYEEARPIRPHIFLDLKFDRYDCESLQGKCFDRDSLAIDESEESVYLFGAHNPVHTLWILFESTADHRPVATVHLRLDFDFEGRIGGVIEHSLRAPVAIENR